MNKGNQINPTNLTLIRPNYFTLTTNQTWSKLVYDLSSFEFDKLFRVEPEFEPFFVYWCLDS